MKKNRRGWIRILEAVISIMIISSVLLIVYSRQAQAPDISERVYTLQREILADISLDSGLRTLALAGEEVELSEYELSEYARGKIPPAFDFYLRVCELEDIGTCKLRDDEMVRKTKDKDVFVEEIILSSELETYDPKKVRLFVWEVG